MRFPATPGRGPLAAMVCGVWCVVCGGGVLVGLWLVCGVVGPSPLLAEVPVCYSPPLLAGFRCRCWWAVLATPGCGSRARFPATPGWVSLSAVVGAPRHSWLRVPGAVPRHSWPGSAGGDGVWCVVCGVRRWCVGGVVAGVWCGRSLATPGGGSCVLLPATPGWVSLPVVVGIPRHSWRKVPGAVPRHSWLGFAFGGGVWCVVCGVWCVVCGVRRWFVGGVLAGVWCGWSLATSGGGSCVLLPATPGSVSLPVLVDGPCHSWLRVPGAVPRHSWLGSAGNGGVWCVVCGVWCVVCGGGVLVGLWLVCGVVGCSPLLAEVPVCYSPPLLAGVSLPVLVGGPRHSWLWVPGTFPRHSWLGSAGGGGVSCVVCGVWCVVWGGGVLVQLWLVCGVFGPSPLLAEVPVCYSLPLLAGFRCRWWWAFLATPG